MSSHKVRSMIHSYQHLSARISTRQSKLVLHSHLRIKPLNQTPTTVLQQVLIIDDQIKVHTNICNIYNVA